MLHALYAKERAKTGRHLSSGVGLLRHKGGLDVNDTIDRIQASWALAASDGERASHLFYANLFRLDPASKALFAGDMKLQGRKLAQTLTFIVDHLDDPETLFPAAVDLAVRHVSYGVTAEQYDMVGRALIDSLRQILGPAFTPEDEAAWRDTYSLLANTMVEAAYPK